MEMHILLYNNHGVYIETSFLEEVLFILGDVGNIRVVLEPTLVASAAAALGGALLGAFAGGKTGAVLGAGLAGAIYYGTYTEMTLRKAWKKFKNKLYGLLLIIHDFLRSLDCMDYFAAAVTLVTSPHSREEVCEKILHYIVAKLGMTAYRQIQ